MNFIIHLAATSDPKFKQGVQRLLQVDASQITEMNLAVNAPAVETVLAGGGHETINDLKVPGFSEQLNTLLPTVQNINIKNSIDKEVKSFINKENEGINEVIENESGKNQTATDLLIFDNQELRKHPYKLNSLFNALESRPCSILFLDSGFLEFKKFVLKYNGKEPSIFSMYAFARLFPQIAKVAEDAVIISPFMLKKSQLALEKRIVKKIGAYYENVGFIKLPFIDIDDYHHYALKVKADLLIFSKSDLKGIRNLIIDKNFSYNGSRGVSFFVG